MPMQKQPEVYIFKYIKNKKSFIGNAVLGISFWGTLQEIKGVWTYEKLETDYGILGERYDFLYHKLFRFFEF